MNAKAGAEAADAVDELAASHRDFVRAAGALGPEHFAEQGAAREMFLGAGPSTIASTRADPRLARARSI